MQVYLDNAASTKIDPKVEEAMLQASYANPSSTHEAGREARHQLEQARSVIASTLGAAPDEIIFTSGGTESNNLALRGVAKARGSGHIITSSIEHPSILETCKQLEQEGFAITRLPVSPEGRIDPQEVRAAIKESTILVSIMHANNEVGSIQDLKRIGTHCQDAGVLFHTDAVQSYAKETLDVRATPVDMVSLSAHKIHGPKGIGALYIRGGAKVRALLSGGDQEGGLRAGTENVPGAAGFARAATLLTAEDISRMREMRDTLITELLKLPGGKLNGPLRRLCNNISISFNAIEAPALVQALSKRGVYISTGSACASYKMRQSHVLDAIGLPASQSFGTIRISLSKDTTQEELDYALGQIRQALQELRPAMEVNV